MDAKGERAASVGRWGSCTPQPTSANARFSEQAGTFAPTAPSPSMLDVRPSASAPCPAVVPAASRRLPILSPQQCHPAVQSGSITPTPEALRATAPGLPPPLPPPPPASSAGRRKVEGARRPPVLCDVRGAERGAIRDAKCARGKLGRTQTGPSWCREPTTHCCSAVDLASTGWGSDTCARTVSCSLPPPRSQVQAGSVATVSHPAQVVPPCSTGLSFCGNTMLFSESLVSSCSG